MKELVVRSEINVRRNGIVYETAAKSLKLNLNKYDVTFGELAEYFPEDKVP